MLQKLVFVGSLCTATPAIVVCSDAKRHRGPIRAPGVPGWHPGDPGLVRGYPHFGPSHPGLGGLRSAIKVPVATEAEAKPPGPPVPPVAVPPYPLSIPCEEEDNEATRQKLVSRAVLDAQLGSLAAPPTEKGLLSPDQMLALTKAQLAEDTEVEKRKLEAKKASQASSITRPGNFFPTGPSQPRGRGRGAIRGFRGRGGKFSAPHPRSTSESPKRGQHGKRGRGTF